jgi:phage terminase large subunit
MINLNISSKVFNPLYYDYLNDETHTQIFFGGSSSGKSYFVIGQRCVIDMLKGGHNYLIVRNTQLTVRKSVFNEILKAISFFKVGSYFNVNKTDLVITCHNGHSIMMAGLDDAEKIKSITPSKGVITDIIVEEATETEYAAVKQLYKRLRGFSKVKKRVILLFNPILKTHWIYQEYFGEWDDSKQVYKSDDLLIVKSTYKDNKFLTPEDVYQLENEKDIYYREVYTLGNWGVLGAVIFKNWSAMDTREEQKKFGSNWFNGLDFGFSADPSAFIRCYYDRMRMTIYITDELYLYGATNDILASEVKQIISRDPVTCDCAGSLSIQELRQHGVTSIPCKKGKDSVNFGIQWLQKMQIVVDKSCQNFLNEIQQYKWREDKDGNATTQPIDRNNHLLDALRYALEQEMNYVELHKNNVKIPRIGAM